MRAISVLTLCCSVAIGVLLTGAGCCFALEPPIVKSLDYNLSLDFEEDGVLDDAQIIWEPVPGALRYQVVLHYEGGYGYGGEFTIRDWEITELENGDLKFIWADYIRNHYDTIPYPINGISMISLDIHGLPGALSDLAYFAHRDTLVYGKVTSEQTGAPLEGARVHYIQHDIHHGGYFGEGETYTDGEGKYYILGLSDGASGSGAPVETYIDISRAGHITSEGNTVILRNEGKIVNKDFVLSGKSATPYMYYMYNRGNRLIYWRGYDPENRRRLKYSYRFDDGEWTRWTSRRYMRLRYFLRRGILTRGWHRLEVKAQDRDGLESHPETIYFELK